LSGLLLLSATAAQAYLSPCDIDLSHDGKTLYITAATDHRILVFDKAERKVYQSIPLPGKPTDLVLHGDRLLVTGGGHEGAVWEINAGRIVNTIRTGHTPMSPAISPGGPFMSATALITRFRSLICPPGKPQQLCPLTASRSRQI